MKKERNIGIYEYPNATIYSDINIIKNGDYKEIARVVKSEYGKIYLYVDDLTEEVLQMIQKESQRQKTSHLSFVVNKVFKEYSHNIDYWEWKRITCEIKECYDYEKMLKKAQFIYNYLTGDEEKKSEEFLLNFFEERYKLVSYL